MANNKRYVEERTKTEVVDPKDKKNPTGSNSRYPDRRRQGKGRDYGSKAPNDCSRKTSDVVGVGNDPKWYTRNSQLISDASKLSFANQLGAKIFTRPVPSTNLSGGGYLTSDYIPGICGLKMVNTPGIAGSASDGVNMAAADLFQRMRAGLNTYAAYQAADVMMYALAIDSVYSMYANISRIFGILPTYQASNLYTPIRLLHAGYGFSVEEVANIIANKANYLLRFNQLVFKASTLYLPVDFTIVNRHAWLYMNYFVDNALSTKAQYYIHRMMGAHKLNEQQSTQGTMLEYVENPTTLSELLDLFESMIDVIRSSDSMLKIAGDMKGALKTSSTWKLSYIQETYVLAPVSDPFVLMQIHNMSIYPNSFYQHLKTILEPTDNEVGFSITQDVTRNIVLAGPVYKVTGTESVTDKTGWNILCQEKMLDFPVTSPTQDMIVEATRNTLGGVTTTATDVTLCSLRQTGVDICVGLTIEGIHPKTPNAIYNNDVNAQAVDMANDGNRRSIVMLSRFAYAPYLAVWNVGWGDSGAECTLIGDVNTFTMVDNEVLNGLNANILASMWGIQTSLTGGKTSK